MNRLLDIRDNINAFLGNKAETENFKDSPGLLKSLRDVVKKITKKQRELEKKFDANDDGFPC